VNDKVEFQSVSGGGGGAGTSDATEATLSTRLSESAFTGRFGATNDAAATTDTGTFSHISLFKRLLERVTVLLGYFRAEDAPSGDAHEGLPVLLVRRDTASVGAGADGDYAFPNVTASGNVRVCIAEEEARESKFAVINASTSGNNTLVAAVVSKKIRVTNIVLVAAGAVTATIQSGAGGTAIGGPVALAANGGFAPGYSPVGHFESAAGVLLNLNLSAAVQCGGWLTYEEV
jgi:hypothetical protein